MEKKELLKNMINSSEYIVFMTGAGISVPSGIPDFRSASGLYSETIYNVSPETILSHTYFMRYPEKFYDYYRNKMLYLDAEPNIAHQTIAKMKNVKAVITQNIDGLHQKAGSPVVIELHGSVHRNYCMKCGKFYPVETIAYNEGVPKCECGGIIKPGVVLYEELLDEKAISDAIYHIRNADLLIVVGTSLLVNPAASLIYYFKGENLVIINKSPTPYDDYAKLIIRDNLETVLTDDLL
ncbi:MAG: NAD-dependent protein deacylase [Bacilli bacterium]|nr:NAD-dependent protein deacylase [Bacilli bacterium]